MPTLKAGMPAGRPTVVLDTTILMVYPSPWVIDELKALGGADFLVPAAVLWELDILITRPELRDRARSAINVLKSLVTRGAMKSSISCGEGSTIRIALVSEEDAIPGLDMGIADDRILATCVGVSAGSGVRLATTEFALFAKAIALGFDSMYLENYAEHLQTVSRREKESFRQGWNRLFVADTPWTFCRRAVRFLQLPVSRRLLNPVRASGEPASVAKLLSEFDKLAETWKDDLSAVLQPVFGLDPPSPPDYSVLQLTIREKYFDFGQIGARRSGWVPAEVRAESADERAQRIKAQESAFQARQDFIVDELFARVEHIRQHMLDLTGEELM
jgi:hypothetical protein